MKIDEFIEKFLKLKAKGFIPSTRKGPTGIGHTLETYLGMSENNIALPDIQSAKLKAHRTNTNSLTTLFTSNRKIWKIPPLEAVRKYGSEDRNGRVGIYYTMSLKPNSAGLFLYIDILKQLWFCLARKLHMRPKRAFQSIIRVFQAKNG